VQRDHGLHHAPGGAQLGDGEEAAQAAPVGGKELGLDHQQLGIAPLDELLDLMEPVGVAGDQAVPVDEVQVVENGEGGGLGVGVSTVFSN
jgi:hypothetical protein